MISLDSMTWEKAKTAFSGAVFDEATREMLLPSGVSLSFAPPAVSHEDVVRALRRVLVDAAGRVSSPEDIEALARLMEAYNAAKDWFP